MQTKARTQARVYAVTQQDADVAPDMVTGIISILDHDAYTLVDPGAMHSFASKLFLDRFQIETQPLEGRMRVSLPAGDPLVSDRVVRDNRILLHTSFGCTVYYLETILDGNMHRFVQHLAHDEG